MDNKIVGLLNKQQDQGNKICSFRSGQEKRKESLEDKA
jgi:hypothetical protein